MNELSDRDWQLVNAYHDGELGEAEMRDVNSRIASEPALALALKEVASVSASLAALRPELGHTASVQGGNAANDSWHPAKWLASVAIAAAIALAVVFGPRVLSEPTVFDMHAEFAGQTYTVDGSDLRPVVARGFEGVPDLSSANLTPVALRTFASGTAMHYAGRNGCRLTYFRGAFGIGEVSRFPDQQLETWTTIDNVRHMIVATGMDQPKFDAIATYLKLATRQKSTESILAAMSDATKAAAPCVG